MRLDLWTLLVGLAWFAAMLNVLLALRVVRFLQEATTHRHAHRDAGEPARIGEPAPGFAVAPAQGGARLGLWSFPGRPLLLVFVHPECGPCRLRLAEAVEAAAPAREREGLVLLLVSGSDPIPVRAWVSEVLGATAEQVDVVIAEHPDDTPPLWHSYNPQGLMPTFFYIDADHVARAAGHLFNPEWNWLAAQWRRQPVASGQ